MNRDQTFEHQDYEGHQNAWAELAAGIASLKNSVRVVADGEIAPESVPGELTIIGSGIESVGFSIGDEKLLRAADKVLYCVADPATVVWLKRLRPDALDLYVLYGEDKIRYTTYMQMAEAQLYWVRQGLKVVVVFYGHPGVFVLSTHRAILIARREGHRALMKAGVCALDTLCADLGVDPCHPGLQTHEATDSLSRQRRLDPTLHVILWQVGLIGELGYRRHGYLNSGFSIFVNWLIEHYGPDYQIVHYIGSRYPTIAPLIEKHCLKDLHDPRIQATITGISTFYLPPRDVVPTDRQMALELGLLKQGQHLVTPTSPLREIGQYGPRELAAFDAYRRFAIPTSYRWQGETAASDFLIELRLDIALQELYRRDPAKALDDPRFARLSERERQLLASRDSGALQVAAKGGYIRSEGNEQLIRDLLGRRGACLALLARVAGQPAPAARAIARQWVLEQHYRPDWSRFHASLDLVYRTALFPWTGVYVTPDGLRTVTLIGHRQQVQKSVLYVNEVRIRRFELKNGTVLWQAQAGVPHGGFLKLDLQPSGARRLVGKIWVAGQTPGTAPAFVAEAADPDRAGMKPHTALPAGAELYGRYVLRSNGRFARMPTAMTLSAGMLSIDGAAVAAFTLTPTSLAWSGGTRDFDSGRIDFVRDPVIGSIELYGKCSDGAGTALQCYGARIEPAPGVPGLDGCLPYGGPALPPQSQIHLVRVAAANLDKGGLMLWHKWEKAHLTSMAVAQVLASLL